MPSPNKDETEKEFISRCMGDEEARKSFPEADQRAAFCYSTWRKHHEKSNMAETETGILKDVEIFAVGTWKGSREVKADGAMLDEIVTNFHNLNKVVSGFGVPAKLGHSTPEGSPALGWVTDLVRVGDVLVADFADVPVAIIDAISKRRYNSTSIELAPKISYSGKTYHNVLAAVAFLGAEWPAVKGLKPLSASKFAEEGDEILTLMEHDVPNDNLKFSQADADALVLAAETRVRTEFQAKLDKANGEVATAENRATVAETALRQFKEDADKRAFADVLDQAIKDGKVLPKNRALLEAVATQFSGKGKVKVGDKEYTPVDLFKQYVSTMPKVVKFGESGTADQADVGNEATAREEVAKKAQAKVDAAGGRAKLSFEAAVDAVLREDDDLKQRYAAGE